MRRGPRKSPPALDRAIKAQGDTERWLHSAGGFLVALEASILAGEATLPAGLYKPLYQLLRGDP